MVNCEKNSIDILLVVSPSNARSPYMPFYFLYLAGYLEKQGFLVDIVDTHSRNVNKNKDYIIQVIKQKNPRYIAIAAFVTDFDVVTSLSTTIKKHSDAKILVGNAHASLVPQDFLYEGSPFDVVVRREGELTVEQILLEYDDAKDNSHINGIAYWYDGKIKITGNRELMDLSECGMPAYHKIDMKWFSKPSKYIIRRIPASCAVIYTGRGCPFKCVFCASNSVWQANKSSINHPIVRKRPINMVIEELRILHEIYNFDFFYIMDDTFGINEADIYEFCNSYRQSGLKMLWGAETRVSCIQNEKIVKTMTDAGCIQLDFGVETGSSKLLRIIRKGITVDQISRAFSLCNSNGIRTFANILLNLPEETEDDLLFTQELLHNITPTYISVGITQPYPGTECYDKYLNFTIAKEDYHTYNRLIPLGKYRMSKHKLNLDHLLHEWQLKYGIYTPIESNIFHTDGKYWSTLLNSKRKCAYLLTFLKDILIFPFIQYILFRVRIALSYFKSEVET